MDNSQNNIGYFPQMPLCDKHLSVELNSDFTLPDYQPEIRKLLSTRAIILPQSEYLGNGNADIQGEICYKITYLGADYCIYCTTLSDKYGFSTSLDFNSHSIMSEGTTLIPHCTTESMSTRVLGPRKLNVRARLTCHLLAFSPAEYLPNLVGAHNKANIENKICTTNCINIKKGFSEAVLLNDFITFDTPIDNVRIIDCTSTPIVNECLATNDKISIRGDVVLKLLYCNDAEGITPLSITRKLPFTCDVLCAGVNSLFECTAHGVCYDEGFDFKENGLALEITLSLFALAQKNEPVKYVEDSYSTEKVCEASSSKLFLNNSVRCCYGNLTQNEVFMLESIRLSPNAKIVDTVAKSSINELSFENDKLVLKGNNDFQLIYSIDGEYASLSLSSPIRYEVDCRHTSLNDNLLKWFAKASTSSVRARLDGERLFIDSELNICLSVISTASIDILSEMMFGEYLKKPLGEILLCYPDKSATVWSIGKQYGEAQKSLRAKNAIPESEEQAKKRYLII